VTQVASQGSGRRARGTWQAPAVETYPIDSGRRTHASGPEPVPNWPPVIAKDTGATDHGGKGYTPKGSEKTDMQVTSWP
jgi:hypothetical protein